MRLKGQVAGRIIGQYDVTVCIFFAPFSGAFMRLIVAITGASGAIYGIRLLEALREVAEVETHLILSNGGKLNIALETGGPPGWKPAYEFSDQNLAATIASGSFHGRHDRCAVLDEDPFGYRQFLCRQPGCTCRRRGSQGAAQAGTDAA
jgi:hypothetical protein